MKKYNKILCMVTVLYILFAVIGVVTLQSQQEKSSLAYRVEINRLYARIANVEEIDSCIEKINEEKYEYIVEVAYLSVNEKDEQVITSFYEDDSAPQFIIKPLIDHQSVSGYLRFSYRDKGHTEYFQILILEILLFLWYIVVLVVLLYLKYQVIRPFIRLSELPMELAKGHLKTEITEEKSRYFGRYLWGMSQLKDNLESAKRRELELEKEKKLLLLSLSHDIKTPLNTIKLYAKAIEKNLYKDAEEIKQAAVSIGDKTVVIENYVQEIMKNSRENIIDVEVSLSEFYLAELLERIGREYGEKCRLRHCELKIQPYENILLKGDYDRCLEVFDNLFDNAFKYGDGKQIEISCAEEEDCHLIQFFNTGTVLSEEELIHVFESFYRASNSEGKQGHGLGLYICYEIMHKMDGDIFAETCQNGMRFTLIFR